MYVNPDIEDVYVTFEQQLPVLLGFTYIYLQIVHWT